MTTLTKTCTKCGIELPATTEHFSPVKNVKCGLRGKCKRCVAQEARERYHADPEKREKAKAASNAWRANNKDREKARIRRYQQENREYHRKRNAEWQRANPEKMQAARKRYAAKNPEALVAVRQNRRAREKAAGGKIRKKDIQAQYSAQNGKCWWCGKDVGGTYHVDHLIPLAKGGTNKSNNIVIACPFCNQSKHDKLPHEWCGRLF